MKNIPFNTHQFVKDLKAMGMEEKVAEALAEHQLAMYKVSLKNQPDIADIKRDISICKKHINNMKKISYVFSIVAFVVIIEYLFR